MGLRVERHQAGLSYPQLAQRVGYSVAALASAAAGDRLPSRAITIDYVAGCRGDVDTWTTRWIEAHAQLNNLVKPAAPTGAEGVAVFAERLSTLLRWKGLTSANEVAKATGTLSRSTVHRILTGATIPTRDTLAVLLSLALETHSELQVWMTARMSLLGLPGSVEDVFAPPGTATAPEQTAATAPDTAGPERSDEGAELLEWWAAESRARGQAPSLPTPKLTETPLRVLHLDTKPLLRDRRLRDEIYYLRKGAGVMRGNLGEFPALARLARVSGAPELMQQKAIISLLTAAVDEIPEPMDTIAAAMLNLPSAPRKMRQSALHLRFAALGIWLDRDVRTVQRRAEEATRLLLEVLESRTVVVAESDRA